MGIIIDISRWSQWIQTQRQALDKLDRWKTVLVRWCYASYLQHTRLCSSSTGSDSSDYSWKTQKNATASTLLLFTSLFHYRVSTLTCFTVNKCIGDDTKAAARQSLNCIKNKKNKIWRKTIFNMPDGILTPCNVAGSQHWFRHRPASDSLTWAKISLTLTHFSHSAWLSEYSMGPYEYHSKRLFIIS